MKWKKKQRPKPTKRRELQGFWGVNIPPCISHKKVIWKGSHNAILRGLTITTLQAPEFGTAAQSAEKAEQKAKLAQAEAVHEALGRFVDF